MEQHNTIIVWSENLDINNFVNDYCKYSPIKVFKARKLTEVLSTPNFLLFIDLEYFNKMLQSENFNLPEYVNKNQNSVILNTNALSFTILAGYEKFLKKAPLLMTKKFIDEEIGKRYKTIKPIKTTKDAQLKSKLFRLICLYKMLDTDEPVKTKEICEKFQINERTLRRDIKVLREVDPEIKIYYYKEEGYTLEEKFIYKG